MRWAAYLLSLIGLLGGTFSFLPESSAQLFRLGEWEGSFESGVDYARQDTKTAGSQANRLESVLVDNRLTLRNVGAYILDPRFINLSLGGTFGLSQNWLTTDSRTDNRDGKLLGYDFFSSILPDRAYSLNLFANRNQTFLSGGLPGTIDVLSENRGATIFAKRLYIPSTLAFKQEIQDQESRSGGIVARRSDRRNVLTYEGQRGWIDSEAGLRYEFVDLSDEVFPSLSYQSHEGSLVYSLDFGPELNRRWDSRARLFTRTGITDVTTLTVDETLRVDHTERLRTDYRYLFTRTDTVGGAAGTHTAAFGLSHRLFDNLTTTFRLDNIFQKLPGGRKETVRSQLNLSYTKRLPGDGRLNAAVGSGLQYDDSRFQTTDTFVPQETHTVETPIALPISLNNLFIVAGRIAVTKTAFGPLPPGCFPPPGPPTPLVLGRDYTLQAFGDITQLVPVPCSGITPGINPGDTIAVDYRFSVSPSLSFLTVPVHFNVSVDYRWIRPYFVHEQVEQFLVSGRDGKLLDDRISDTLGTELRYDGRRVRASALGEIGRFRSTRTAYDSVRSNQFLGFTILPELTLTANADESWLSFSRPDRQTRTVAARATLTYLLGASLFADAFVGMRLLDDTLVPTERLVESGLRVRWRYGRVDVLPSVEFSERRRGSTDTRQIRATLRLIRWF